MAMKAITRMPMMPRTIHTAIIENLPVYFVLSYIHTYSTSSISSFEYFSQETYDLVLRSLSRWSFLGQLFQHLSHLAAVEPQAVFPQAHVYQYCRAFTDGYFFHFPPAYGTFLFLFHCPGFRGTKELTKK